MVASDGGADSIETYSFRADAGRDDILMTVWDIDVDGDNRSEIHDTIQGLRYEWSRKALEPLMRNRPTTVVEAISANGARGRASIEAIPNWTVFTEQDGLAGDTITCLAIDSSGTLWAGLESGHIACQNESGDWELHRPPKPSEFGRVRSILVDPRGGVWVGVIPPYNGGIRPGGGLWLFEDGAWTSQGFTDTDSWIRSLALAGDHTIWITTGKVRKGAYTFDLKDTVISYVYIDSLFYDPQELDAGYTNEILGAFSGLYGSVWFGTLEVGLVYHDGETIWERVSPSTGVPSGRVYDLQHAPGLNLWIATAEGGVGVRERGTNQWLTFDVRNGLPHNRVFCLAADDENRTWAGTLNGLAIIEKSGGKWRARDTGKLKATQINAMLVQDRVLWIATRDGLVRYHYPE